MNTSKQDFFDRSDRTILHYALYTHQYIGLPMVNYAKTHFGWTSLQFGSVAYLKRFGHLSMSELAHYLLVSKQQATQLVNSLVKHGLAQRQHNEYNRRIIYVVPTQTAIDQLQAAEQAYIDAIKESLSLHSEEEITSLLSAMDQLIAFSMRHGEDLILKSQITDQKGHVSSSEE